MVEHDGLKAEVEKIEDEVLGVYLFGSHATGTPTPRSDIDICIVAGPGKDLGEVLRYVWRSTELGQPPYDVRIFEELPLYLKGRVLEEGELIASRDEPALAEYVRHWWKLWAGQAHRNRITQGDVQRILAARRA